ncbi:MAG: tetratricopeptide repeat protein [candidate division Zixibacteria bacterium]|nr:tetratricopeptide repeat protein [candidate division Zixibacteria bacterium]
MGIALKKERRYNEAKACFERILEMQIHPTKPKFVSVVMQELSQIFQSTGDYSTAWDYLDKALEVKPGLFLIYHNRLCLASIEHDEAKLFSVFMEMEEQLPDWYKNEHLTKLLKTDGELEYLRNSIPFLWNKINKEVRQ